jgi:hypothetical protein
VEQEEERKKGRMIERWYKNRRHRRVEGKERQK